VAGEVANVQAVRSFRRSMALIRGPPAIDNLGHLMLSRKRFRKRLRAEASDRSSHV
jgi:hypothetical protein